MPRPHFNNRNRTARSKKPKIVGDVRQYQLVNSFGVGSIVDFTKDTVIIAGVDDWDGTEDWEDRKIYNENLQALTGAKFFLTPKTASGSRFSKSRDIPAYVFPEMLYCPKCRRLIHYKEAANTKNPNLCCLNDKNGNLCKGRLVASRFVVVCENGHVEDFPYSWWVHRGETCGSGKDVQRMKMYNIAGRSDVESLFVECEDCGKRRSLNGAFAEHSFSGENGYHCNCNHPHLKTKKRAGETGCDKPLKTRLRSASGVYFPVSYSALSIPPWNRKAVQIVEGLYEYLEDMTKDKILKHLANKAAASIPIEQLLEAYEIIKARKTEDTPRSEADIYFDEYKVLGKGDLQSEDEYSAFTAEIPPGFERYFDKITVVDKLTVVQALKGFTRLKPWNGNSSAVAPLSSTQKEWLPAVKLNGEGVFFKFNEEILLSWAERAGQRYEEMETALENSFYKDANPRFSPRYVLLHTFAHLLIRQLANECGYSASSIREKIYSSFKGERNQMYGVLIYLASSDADGSLGGLISIAEDPERLRGILENMLHKAQWCSADPLCITSKNQGFLSLNYAACHDCVLLPETSCESGNILLDRVSVVGTPDDLSAGLFGDYLSRE